MLTLEESSEIKKSDSGKACRAIAVEFHMDEAISASELAENVLDAILWLKSAWDNVQSATIQIKCGFSHTLLNEDEDVEVDEDLEHFEVIMV